MNYTTIVDEQYSHIIWKSAWLDAKIAVKYFNALVDGLDWVQAYKTYEFKKKGDNVIESKNVKVPRLMYYCGDDRAHNNNKYADEYLPLNPWEPDIILPLVNLANKQLDVNFNTCLVNYYRNTKDFIMWHGDRECAPPNCIVLTLALFPSETDYRDFQVRRSYIKGENATSNIKTIPMRCGDAIVMFGERSQTDWWHCVPKRSKGPPRISITFREINI